jgi:hypothetical protein
MSRMARISKSLSTGMGFLACDIRGSASDWTKNEKASDDHARLHHRQRWEEQVRRRPQQAHHQCNDHGASADPAGEEHDRDKE